MKRMEMEFYHFPAIFTPYLSHLSQNAKSLHLLQTTGVYMPATIHLSLATCSLKVQLETFMLASWETSHCFQRPKIIHLFKQDNSEIPTLWLPPRQWFSKCCLVQQPQHLLKTSWKCKFSDQWTEGETLDGPSPLYYITSPPGNPEHIQAGEKNDQSWRITKVMRKY